MRESLQWAGDGIWGRPCSLTERPTASVRRTDALRLPLSWFGVDGVCGLPRPPVLQPVEIEIDNRRRIEREDLADDEAADDCDAKRLPHLGPGAAAERERQRPEHRGHG